ncbi:MAG: YncE family protein [Chitinispirillaceae bacterium]|nr:YncE family protein [Chitinispirillaceae bacterium]
MRKRLLALAVTVLVGAGYGDYYPDVVVATVGVGNSPSFASCLPDGKYIYVPNYHDGTVSVIRTSDNAVVETVYTGTGPHETVTHANGQFVYVANRGSANVSVIRTSDNMVVATVNVHGPIMLASPADDNIVYVTSNGLYAINTLSNQIVSSITGAVELGYPVFSPDYKYCYVTDVKQNLSNGDIWIVGTTNHDLVKKVSVGAYPGWGTFLPSGDCYYVPNRKSNSVSVIRTSDQTVAQQLVQAKISQR